MKKKIMLTRSISLLVVYLMLFGVLWWRVKLRTVDEAQSLSVQAESQYADRVDVSDINYMLFDHNGKELLSYKNKYYAVIDPLAFTRNNTDTKTDDLYALIYILQNYNEKYNLSTIGLSNSSKKINFEIDEATYNKLKNIKDVKGFYTYSFSSVDRTEAWKIENVITSPKRTEKDEFKSSDSLEMLIYNKTKENQTPKIKFTKNVEGDIVSQDFIAPTNNTNVRLTLDKNIQDKIQAVLKSDKYKNLSQAGVILMESSTGRILSMTQKDNTLPNVNIAAATQQGYDPGSIFKVIVEEAGIDRKTISLSTKFSCKNSIYQGAYDKCKEKDHGTLTPEEALVVSCNNIFAQIGDKVGVNNFIDNAQSQGLFSKVLNIDSETKGTYDPPKAGEGAGQLAIGQSMGVSPIQAVSIANTVANGGVYVKPYLVEAYVDNNNNVLETVKTSQHPSINKSTAAYMKEQMIKVVRFGTGVSAKIDNVEVGGKTGTSTRFDGTNRTSDGWFSGFFKVKNKYYSMVVFVKDIDIDKEQAATTAAPIFKDIVQSTYSSLEKISK